MEGEIALGVGLFRVCLLCGGLVDGEDRLCVDLVYGDRQDASLFFDDAGVEAAVFAGDSVVEDAVLGSEGKPDAGQVAGAEDANAGGLHGGSQMRGTGVVAEEDDGALEDGGALSRGEVAAEVEGRRGRCFAPDFDGKLTGRCLDESTADDETMIGVALGEPYQERLPVVFTPLVCLIFCAKTDGKEGAIFHGLEYIDCSGVLGGCEHEIPTLGGMQVRVSQLADVAGEAAALRFVDGSVDGGTEGRAGKLVVVLHVVGEGHTDDAPDAAEAKEEGVASCVGDPGSCSEIDCDVGMPDEDLPPYADQFADVAGAQAVAKKRVNEAGVFEDGGGCGSFFVGREAGEQASFCVGEGAGYQLETWQRDNGIAETAEPVDENLLDGLPTGHKAILFTYFSHAMV